MTRDPCRYTGEPCCYPDMPCCTCPESHSIDEERDADETD